MEEVGHQQKKYKRNTPQKTNKMKSGVSDVGSHVTMYTNIIHHGLNRRTPVTTACHFARGTLDKDGQHPLQRQLRAWQEAKTTDYPEFLVSQ